MPRSKRSRSWTWTFFHYDQDIIELIMAITHIYLVFQTEITSTGQHHLQGFIYFQAAKTLAAVRRLFPRDTRSRRSIHLIMSDGTPLENRTYCLKEGSRLTTNYLSHESGDLPVSGRRRDLDSLLDLIKTRPLITELELWENNRRLMLQYGRRVLHFQSLLLEHSALLKITTVFWGPTGTGKSHQALLRASTAVNQNQFQVYYMPTPPPGGVPWADGYTGQTDVILEDYSGEIPLRLFLRMLDHYPLKLQVKGGFTMWIPQRIWITTNSPPQDWYGTMEYTGSPLERRLTRDGSSILNLTEVYVPTDPAYLVDNQL